ncbi:MAG: DUF58 domain-containing protein [Proteobacteria bacterium]|nr:DUF58 domain-containing protein [Pseudomonadota bacterium]
MIDRELLRRIRKIEIYTGRLVNDQLAGQYHSVFKGRGMAFSEVRQYQPGDDIRLIDWNVSARMNDVYVKLFSEERELTVMLLVDMSASSALGSQPSSKRALTAEVAATFAFSAIKNNDRVGLIIFSDGVERFVPPKKGRKHVLRVISEILSYRPRRMGTDLAAALGYLGRVVPRRCVAFLLSDFVGDAELPLPARDLAAAPDRHAASVAGGAAVSRMERAWRVIARRHDLIPVAINDPLDQSLAGLGIVRLLDVETGELLTFDSAGPEAAAFARHMRRARQERQAFWRRLELDGMELSTAEPYLSTLVAFFRRRQLRLRHG